MLCNWQLFFPKTVNTRQHLPTVGQLSAYGRFFGELDIGRYFVFEKFLVELRTRRSPNLLKLLYGLYNSLRVSRETFIKRKHLPTVGQLFNHIDLREVLFTWRTENGQKIVLGIF